MKNKFSLEQKQLMLMFSYLGYDKTKLLVRENETKRFTNEVWTPYEFWESYCTIGELLQKNQKRCFINLFFTPNECAVQTNEIHLKTGHTMKKQIEQRTKNDVQSVRSWFVDFDFTLSFNLRIDKLRLYRRLRELKNIKFCPNIHFFYNNIITFYF